jgi:hypothetical protein
LYLSNGEVYVKTLLERAKGSALDITTKVLDPVGAIALVPPHAKQIRHLDFACNHWVSIQKFSEVNSGPLPLLTTIEINAITEFNLEGPDEMTPPSLPLFSNAVNLKEFSLFSEGSPFLHHFCFPNLTTFELSAVPEDFRVSQLLNFLEASPMLQTVGMKIIAGMVLEDVPRERVIVLPNVETFSLVVNTGGPDREIATHISCPSARHTSLMHETYIGETTPLEILPSSVSWNAVVRQCTRSPVEEVTLKIQIASDPIIACSLAFQSSDAAVTRLGFKLAASDEESDAEHSEYMHSEVFSQASRIIRDHPLLSNAKRLHIDHSSHFHGPARCRLIANEVGQVFKSIGSLEELTIDGCDLRSYLLPFLDLPESHDIGQQFTFPPVKELTILHPISASQEECMMAIVRLAKSQHALGIPFERVTVSMRRLPSAMEEGLRPWVKVVDCYEDLYMGDHE